MICVHKPSGWFFRNFASGSVGYTPATRINPALIEQVDEHTLGSVIRFTSGIELVVTEGPHEVQDLIESVQ